MKYLIKRDDFLRAAKKSSGQGDLLMEKTMTGLQSVNEAISGPFENDLGWGDSLLGRLVNSFIRKAKIGYNATKVEPLLNALRSQLDILIANALSSDTKKEFNRLRIKSYLSELKNICTDDISDDEKLDELIGGHEDLWDPRRQDGGLWSNILTNGVLVDTHDFIENEMDKEDLKKAGIPRDGLLDKLSVFIDNLRKLTVAKGDTQQEPEPVPEPEEEPAAATFLTNFRNLAAALSRMNEGHSELGEIISNSVAIKRYDNFILERTAEETRKILMDQVANRERQLKDIKDAAEKKQAENELETVKRKLKEVESKISPNKEDKKTGEVGFVKPGKSIEKGKTEVGIAPVNQKEKTEVGIAPVNQNKDIQKQTPKKEVPNELGADSKSRLLKIKRLAMKCVDKKINSMEEFNKDSDCVALIKALASMTSSDLEYMMSKNAAAKVKINGVDMPLDNATEVVISDKMVEGMVKNIKVTGVRIKDSSAQIKVASKYSKDQKKEILTKRLNRYKAKLAKRPNDEFSKKRIKELELFLKQIGEGFSYEAAIYEATGSGTASTINDVKDCWDAFVEEADLKKEQLEISQREHDRLNGLLSGLGSEDTVLEYDLAKNPDPIIAIARLFKRAHDLYFTPLIPSGRSGGRVSNRTFLEYEYLGSGTVGSPETPGNGPWAIKSIRNKWTDGVMEILEDQNYRKILANIKFIVPGSEDTFNKESFSTMEVLTKIFEAEADDKDAKSQGQVLFQFINDMLEKETAAEFDKRRKELLKRYFGFKEEQIKGITSEEREVNRRTPPPLKEPDKGDTDANTLFWSKAQEFGEVGESKIVEGRIEGDIKGGPIYAIPIEKLDDHEIVFMQPLKKIVGIPGTHDTFLIKYSFDNDGMIKKINDKYPGYDLTMNWSTNNELKGVYYGLIKRMPTSGKFKIVSMKNGEVESLELSAKSTKTIKNNKGKDVNTQPSVLKMADEKKDVNIANFTSGKQWKDEGDNHDPLKNKENVKKMVEEIKKTFKS